MDAVVQPLRETLAVALFAAAVVVDDPTLASGHAPAASHADTGGVGEPDLGQPAGGLLPHAPLRPRRPRGGDPRVAVGLGRRPPGGGVVARADASAAARRRGARTADRAPEQRRRRRAGCRRSCARRSPIRRSRCSIPDGPVRWLDSGGHSHSRLPVGPGRTATLIPDVHGAAAVALVHGEALRADQELLSAISALVLGTVRHQDATSKLAAAMRQLEQSRRRIAEAGDLERARIERDLHDGAQQRLMMLRIRLSLVEEQLRPDSVSGADAVHDLGDEAERTLDELRSLAHGVYPAILSDRGLRGRAAQPGGHHHRPAAPADPRPHAPADRDRDRGVLHLPRSRAERDQARAVRVRGVGAPAARTPTPCRSRSVTTALASSLRVSRHPGPAVARRVAQHARPARGRRRVADHRQRSGAGHARDRAGAAGPGRRRPR